MRTQVDSAEPPLEAKNKHYTDILWVAYVKLFWMLFGNITDADIRGGLVSDDVMELSR